MKKLSFVLLYGCMCLLLMGCGNAQNDHADEEKAVSETEAELTVEEKAVSGAAVEPTDEAGTVESQATKEEGATKDYPVVCYTIDGVERKIEYSQYPGKYAEPYYVDVTDDGLEDLIVQIFMENNHMQIDRLREIYVYVRDAEKNELKETLYIPLDGCEKYLAGYPSNIGIASHDSDGFYLKVATPKQDGVYDTSYVKFSYENDAWIVGGRDIDGMGEPKNPVYKDAMVKLVEEHILPNGEVVYDAEGTVNYYTVTDVDGDGSEELLIKFSGQMYALFIFEYRVETGEWHEDMTSANAVFYDNGVVYSKLSHNHGRSSSLDDFWPYTIDKYDEASDSYVTVEVVDAWEKNHYSGPDPEFPDALDLDGDGVLYYFYAEKGNSYKPGVIMDKEEYQKWCQEQYGNASEVTFDWYEFELIFDWSNAKG